MAPGVDFGGLGLAPFVLWIVFLIAGSLSVIVG